MVHGTPDWGLKKKSTVYALDDMAELAARLGSIVTFDRRGDVIFLDDFEATTLHWLAVPSGLGASVALDTSTARSANQSVKIVTSATNLGYSSVRKRLIYPVKSKMGAEISFASGDSDWRIRLGVHTFDGSQVQRFQIDLEEDAGKIYYLDSNGALQELASITPLLISKLFYHTLKLVYDLTTQKYIRLMYDSQTYLMTNISGQVEASTIGAHTHVLVDAATVNAVSHSAYFDDFIFTQNEPT